MVTVTGKNFFDSGKAVFVYQGQCNTRCIVLNMPIGVNMQLLWKNGMYTVCPVDFKTGDRCNHTGSAASETQEGERV